MYIFVCDPDNKMSEHRHHWICDDVPGQYYCDDCTAKGWWSIMFRKVVTDE